MDILKLDLGARSYNIIVAEGILSALAGHISTVLRSKKVFIVTDDKVAPHYLRVVQDSLDGANIQNASYVIGHGEQSKNFSCLEALLDNIFLEKPDRNTTLIALGGGVVGDLTGFAASLILRGINFIQIPTTLLAQVDSSVGGKTGVNNKYGKNLIGSFHQPVMVIIDTNTLKTLPEREFLAGYAEVVKYGLINNIDFFNFLDSNITKLLHKDTKTLQYVIKTSCLAKAGIVSEDERESGARALLNLGHTFGHALEKAAGYSDKLLHGEAVSIGMVFAFKLSEKLGLCNKGAVEKLVSHLGKAGLPTSPSGIGIALDVNMLVDAMRQDKKSYDGKMTFILANGIGECFIAKDVAEKVVISLTRDFIST